MDINFFILSCLALFIAGSIKGVIGFGVPTVSIAILTMFAEVSAVWPVIAMAALITNIWQAVNGEHLRELFARFAGLLVLSFAATIATYFLIGNQYPSLTLFVLGTILFCYGLSRLFNKRLLPTLSNERISSPIVGLVQGVATGISGTFIVPMLLYLQDRNLDRDRLIQALGISFTNSAIALSIALALDGQFSISVTTASLLAVVPAIVGMRVGRRLRRSLSETIFERVFLIGLTLAGLNLIIRALS